MERPNGIKKLANVFEPIVDDINEIEETELSIQSDEANVNEAGMINDQNCAEMSITESSSPSNSVLVEIDDILKNSSNMNRQSENTTPLCNEPHFYQGHNLISLANEDSYLHYSANQVDPPNNGINYSVQPSRDPFCFDLPLNDPKTLRFFYNLGLDYFHEVNAARNYCFLRPSDNPVAEQNPIPAQNSGCENNFENSHGENCEAEKNSRKFENDLENDLENDSENDKGQKKMKK